MVISVDVTRQYTVPRYRGSATAIVLAVMMHVLLGLFLFFGLNWQSHAPEAIEAEMWSSLPQIAAPQPSAPPTPIPVPVEQPQPIPVPVEQPQPIPVVPPQEVPPPPAPPDIAIKEPKKEKPKPVPPPPPAPAPKPIPKPVPAAPPPPRAVPSDSLLASMLADGAKPATGKDARTAGNTGSPGYAEKIGALIRNHTSFSGSGNPVVQVTIQLLPSGEVRNAQVKQSSGNAAFDDAVIRGVYATSPFPKDTNGTVPSTMDLKYSLSPLGQT